MIEGKREEQRDTEKETERQKESESGTRRARPLQWNKEVPILNFEDDVILRDWLTMQVH